MLLPPFKDFFYRYLLGSFLLLPHKLECPSFFRLAQRLPLGRTAGRGPAFQTNSLGCTGMEAAPIFAGPPSAFSPPHPPPPLCNHPLTQISGRTDSDSPFASLPLSRASCSSAFLCFFLYASDLCFPSIPRRATDFPSREGYSRRRSSFSLVSQHIFSSFKRNRLPHFNRIQEIRTEIPLCSFSHVGLRHL